MVLGNLFGKKGDTDSPEDDEKLGTFARLRKGLGKTRDALASVFSLGRKLDDDLLEEVETILIQADFGPTLALDLCNDLRESYRDKEFSPEELIPFLKERLRERLGEGHTVDWAPDGTTVILVAGVNGVGKTTSIAKLAHQWKSEGKSVVLAAGDTFRAAAVDQLGVWSERLGIEMVRGKAGSDPAAVVYEAVETVLEKQTDVLLIDTAGRLHTEKPLMDQLGKICRVIEKKLEGGPHEVLQVLDATTGQNAIEQARAFHEAMTVTGLVLTKLDGTARGGVVFSILEKIGLPVKYIGVGEAIEDLQPFNPEDFVEALFD